MKETQNLNRIFEKINRQIEMENTQTSISKRAWYAAGLFAFIILTAFTEIWEIHPAVTTISFFFLIVSVVVAVIFRSREKKLQNLISGKDLIASWQWNEEQKKQYTQYLFRREKNKNLVILMSITFIAIIVFGIFIAVIDEGKLFMLFVLLGLILFLSLVAFSMPIYYRYKNAKGDGMVLLGKKYAYINGYFHNWDFPLSGIKKVKIIQEPFYGIRLTYYYTDRTFRHSETLIIPAPENINLQKITDEIS